MGSGALASTSDPHPETFPDGGFHQSHPDDTILIVGGYTDIDLLAHTPCVRSRLDFGTTDLGEYRMRTGVHVFKLSGRDGGLTHLSTNAIGPNVAFITRSPVNPELFYASTERIDDEGEIITMRLTSDFELLEVSRVRAGGRSTCYLNFSKSKRWLMAVNYWDAKITTMAIERVTGALAASPRSVLMQPEARYVDDRKPTREEHWKYRQKWPHSHCVVTEPYSGVVHFVVDLGLDRVFAYRMDASKGALVLKGTVKLPKGKGPRHLAFHPTARAAYLVNELDSTVSCFKVNLKSSWSSDGANLVENAEEEDCLTKGSTLELMRDVSSLPLDAQGKTTISPQGVWKAASHSSEIRVHPNGKFFVVGNRGHDSLAVFKVIDFAEERGEERGVRAASPDRGGIELVSITPSGGSCPRNFNWAANGRFLAVGNQNSSTLCVFAFDGATGSVSGSPIFQTPVASPNYVFSTSAADPMLVSAHLGARVANAVPIDVGVARIVSEAIPKQFRTVPERSRRSATGPPSAENAKPVRAEDAAAAAPMDLETLVAETAAVAA